jgi:hypothetical protein
MIGRNGSNLTDPAPNDERAGPIGWVLRASNGQPLGPRLRLPGRPLPLRSQRASSLSEMY